MTPRVLFFGLLALGGSLSLAGCGGDDSASDDSTPATTAAADGADSGNPAEKKTGACADATIKGVALSQIAVIDASCDQATTVMSNAGVAAKASIYTEGLFNCTLTGDLYTCADEGTGYITFTLA